VVFEAMFDRMHVNDFGKQTRVICRAVEGAALAGYAGFAGELAAAIAAVCELDAHAIGALVARVVAIPSDLLSIRHTMFDFLVAVRCAPPEMAEKLCAFDEDEEMFGNPWREQAEETGEEKDAVVEVVDDEGPLVKKMRRLTAS
jgi:hypothetical protein